MLDNEGPVLLPLLPIVSLNNALQPPVPALLPTSTSLESRCQFRSQEKLGGGFAGEAVVSGAVRGLSERSLASL